MLAELIQETIPKNATILDIGCGNKKYSNISIHTTTLDAWERVNPDVLLNIEENDLPFKDNSFDIIYLLDIIEHIEKERGEVIIEQCKRICKDKIIIFTPLIWEDTTKYIEDPALWCYGNNYDLHKSLWNLDDFKNWKRIELDPCYDHAYMGYWKKDIK